MSKNSTPSWDDVAKQVIAHLQENYESPKDALDALGSASAGPSDNFPEEKLDTRHKRASAGLSERSRKPSRHDGKRKISGFYYDRETRFLRKEPDERKVTESSNQMAAELLVGIGLLFGTADEQPITLDHTRPLWLRKAMDSLQFWRTTADEDARIAKAYSGFFGHDLEAVPAWWEEALEGQLHCHALHLEEATKRKAHGDPDPVKGETGLAFTEGPTAAWSGPTTGVDVLAFLHHWAEVHNHDVPKELSEDDIQSLLGQVTLGRGGGRHGKKSAKSLVEDFARKLREKQRAETR